MTKRKRLKQKGKKGKKSKKIFFKKLSAINDGAIFICENVWFNVI